MQPRALSFRFQDVSRGYWESARKRKGKEIPQPAEIVQEVREGGKMKARKSVGAEEMISVDECVQMDSVPDSTGDSSNWEVLYSVNARGRRVELGQRR